MFWHLMKNASRTSKGVNVTGKADKVTIREVGLRDGLQMASTQVSTQVKLKWCKLQHEAGFQEMEVTSFVPPKLLPQFADAADVLSGAKQHQDLLVSVLVPNLKGAVLAMEAGAEKITFVLSASEAHNQSNVRMSTDESLTMFADVLRERDERGVSDKTEIAGVIATSFGCSIQGRVEPDRVCQIAEQMAKLGADEISIADTVGYGDPAAVSRLFTSVSQITGDVPIAAHFHDTRGLGLANVYAAAIQGVRRFDASLGGLGGCPFAPGATGNIATEDCAYLLESIGLSTGIDFDKMIAVREQLSDWLPGETLWGKVAKAGLATTFKKP